MRERIAPFFSQLHKVGFEITDYSIADPHPAMPGEVHGITIPPDLHFSGWQCEGIVTTTKHQATVQAIACTAPMA